MVSATRRAFTILCLCAFGTIACDDYRPYKPWFRDTIGWNEEHILYDGHAEPRGECRRNGFGAVYVRHRIDSELTPGVGARSTNTVEL